MAKPVLYEGRIQLEDAPTEEIEFEADDIGLARDHIQQLAYWPLGMSGRREPICVEFRRVGAVRWRNAT